MSLTQILPFILAILNTAIVFRRYKRITADVKANHNKRQHHHHIIIPQSLARHCTEMNGFMFRPLYSLRLKKTPDDIKPGPSPRSQLLYKQHSWFTSHYHKPCA